MWKELRNVTIYRISHTELRGPLFIQKPPFVTQRWRTTTNDNREGLKVSCTLASLPCPEPGDAKTQPPWDLMLCFTTRIPFSLEVAFGEISFSP